MKRLILITCFLLMILSCSDSDKDRVADPIFLLIKVEETRSNGTKSKTNYIYSGNKLSLAVGSNGSYASYNYIGELISEIKNFDSDGRVIQTMVMEYNDNSQLIKRITLQPLNVGAPSGRKSILTYNSDGTISIVGYFGDLDSQNAIGETRKVYFENGEVSRFITYIEFGGTIITKANEYSYDDKNHVNRNTLGFDKISIYDGSVVGLAHNIISSTYTSSDTSSAVTKVVTYTYNAAGYPVTANSDGNNFRFYYK